MIRRMSILAVTALTAVVLLSACTQVSGSGKVVTENRQVSGFDKVELSGVGTLLIEQTGTESLTIEADDNLMQYITTDVSDGTLHISFQDNTALTKLTKLNYNLTVKDLNGLSTSGAGNAKMGTLKSGDMHIKVSGAGDVSIEDITADSLATELSGAGSVTVAGSVQQQTVDIDGAGSYKAGGLQSSEATVKANGAGNATVRVSDKLNATVSGVGNISYIGSPQVTQDISGVGNITQTSDK
jgi:hypothetical protein